MKCIYCLNDKDIGSFTKTEHVLPQSFGLFKKNPVLKNIVCDECNQYFGDNLEIDLARDTFEGQLRYDYHVKKPLEFKSKGKKSRLIIKVSEGPFKGTYGYRYYSEEENKVLLRPSPQIGLLKKNSTEYEYFLLDQVPFKDSLKKGCYNLDDQQAIIILGCDPKIADEVLKEKGFVFKAGGEKECPKESGDNWLCEVEGKIDQSIFRSVAKIALNYLTYWEGKEFVLHSDFNPIRNYIRNGIKVSYPLIRAVNKAILGDEIKSRKRKLGHIITINWAPDKISVIAQVSLFNWITYYVCLAKSFSGEHRNITRGSFFNVNTYEILELGIK